MSEFNGCTRAWHPISAATAAGPGRCRRSSRPLPASAASGAAPTPRWPREPRGEEAVLRVEAVALHGQENTDAYAVRPHLCTDRRRQVHGGERPAHLGLVRPAALRYRGEFRAELLVRQSGLFGWRGEGRRRTIGAAQVTGILTPLRLGRTRTVKQCRTVISSGTSAPLYAEPDVRTTTSMPSSSCVEVPVTRSTSTPSSPEAERPTSSAVRGCWP